MEIFKTHRNKGLLQLAVLAGLFIGLPQPTFAFANCPQNMAFGCRHYNNDPRQPLNCRCYPRSVPMIPATLSGSTNGGFFDSEKYKQCMKTCAQTTHYGEAICDIRCGGW